MLRGGKWLFRYLDSERSLEDPVERWVLHGWDASPGPEKIYQYVFVFRHGGRTFRRDADARAEAGVNTGRDYEIHIYLVPH